MMPTVGAGYSESIAGPERQGFLQAGVTFSSAIAADACTVVRVGSTCLPARASALLEAPLLDQPPRKTG